MKAKFKPGDSVRIRVDHPPRHNPHTRLHSGQGRLGRGGTRRLPQSGIAGLRRWRPAQAVSLSGVLRPDTRLEAIRGTSTGQTFHRHLRTLAGTGLRRGGKHARTRSQS